MRVPVRHIRVVTFDAMNTLLHLRYPVGQIYSNFARDYFQLHFDASSLEKAFVDNYVIHDRRSPCFGYFSDDAHSFIERQKQWWVDVVAGTFIKVDGKIDQTILRQLCYQLYDYFATTRPWILDPSAKSVLEFLRRKGISLAVVSNYDSRLRNILSQFQLLHFFNGLFLSGETGLPKPNEKVFRLVEKLLVANPEEIMHVGDDFEKDYSAAKSAGWSAILLSDSGLGSNGPVADDADIITSLGDLKGRLS